METPSKYPNAANTCFILVKQLKRAKSHDGDSYTYVYFTRDREDLYDVHVVECKNGFERSKPMQTCTLAEMHKLWSAKLKAGYTLSQPGFSIDL